MTLLDFARGPALQAALMIFALGVVWRAVGAALLPRTTDFSRPRTDTGERVAGGLRTTWGRFFVSEALEKRIHFQHIAGSLWHVGFFIVVLFFVPHILFFESLLGFGWPGLPNPVILVVAAITLATLLAVLIRRMTNPVSRIISTADDYISWIVTTLPLVTGIMAAAHLGLRYETMLALHLLSVALLLIWFPFGKLMHLFLIWPARYNVGALFARRGVRV
jgi:nitrate reductase gamma subunit